MLDQIKSDHRGNGNVWTFFAGFIKWVWSKATLQNKFLNPILHGGTQNDPPDWLLYSNPRGMPWMGWFFMTLFLVMLESSWVVHFWDFFLKFPKNLCRQFFPHKIQRGGPYYTSKNTSIFGSFLGSKMVMIQLQMHE